MQESYFCKLNLPQWCALSLLPPVWTLKFSFLLLQIIGGIVFSLLICSSSAPNRGIAAMTYPHTHFLATGRE
jgi:hypothetical protein